MQLRLHENIRPSRARDISENQLLFTKLETEAIGEVVDLFKSQGRRSAAICADGAGADFAEPLIAEFARHGLPVPAITDCSDVAEAARGRDGVFCAVGDAPKLSRTLTRLRSLRSAFRVGSKDIALFQITASVRAKRAKIGDPHRFRVPEGFRIRRTPKSGSPRFRCSPRRWRVLQPSAHANLVPVFPLSKISPIHRLAVALRHGFHRPRSA